MTTFVTHGGAKHLSDVKTLAKTRRKGLWTVHPLATRGSRVVIYLTKPVSAFVAVGTVVGSRLEDGTRHGWPGFKMGDIRIDAMATTPLNIAQAKKRFPRWNWLWMPIKSATVPASYEAQLFSLLSATPPASNDAELPEEVAALDGAEQIRMVRHRKREAWKRQEKIQQALTETGRLRCEVPGCGFDFLKRYGEIGYGYAQVHHLNLLSDATQPTKTMLKDLAIVCANCHAMIHRGGQCRDMAALIPRQRARLRK